LLWQLYPSYLLITLISILAVTWYSSTSLREFFLEQAASDLEARANLIETQILEYLDPLDKEKIDGLCKKIGPRNDTRVTVILPSGLVVGDSQKEPAEMDTHIDRPEFRAAVSGISGKAQRQSSTFQENLMYVAVPIRKGSGVVAVLRTSMPVGAIDRAIRGIQIKMALAGLVMALLAAILCLIVSRRITRPIEEIKKSADCFARGDFGCPLPFTNSEEIGGLSEAMRSMADELSQQISTITDKRNELEAVLSSMVEGVIAVDLEEHVISMNQAAASLFGCEAAAVLGRSIQEVIRDPLIQRFVNKSLSMDEPLEKDIHFYSDRERILNCHGTVLHDAKDQRIGALIVTNDVTRLRELENIRRDFVANVTHEIKTPITAIKGFVETLKDGAVQNAEDAGRFLGIIEKHVERLEEIIEDLLSLSRIEQETEREEIRLEQGSVKNVLRAAVQVCSVQAKSKSIEIQLICDETITARMNPPLLEQVVVNLLDNAIKYSNPYKRIWVDASLSEKEIIIRVRDEGWGIRKEHLPRLFERFYRVDKGRSRQDGGSGLGLAIAKHITQAHGGHITVESMPEKGSVFSLYLPRY
jgi:two-component system phosphate regulon sensor histidine kinase PhoR